MSSEAAVRVPVGGIGGPETPKQLWSGGPTLRRGEDQTVPRAHGLASFPDLPGAGNLAHTDERLNLGYSYQLLAVAYT